MLHNKFSFTASEAIGLWGALLSTFLGLRAIYLNRIRLFIALDIDPQSNEKFEIIVANVGTKPVVINGINFQKKGDNSSIDFGHFGDTFIMAIPPYAYRKIPVSGGYLADFEKANKLRAKVTIAGRRRVKHVVVSE